MLINYRYVSHYYHAQLPFVRTPPRMIGGHRRPLRKESELQANMSVETTCTALVVVGYTFICEMVYLGCLEAFRNCAKTGCAPPPPLLKNLGANVSTSAARRLRILLGRRNRGETYT
jgi:hypothetical protein